MFSKDKGNKIETKGLSFSVKLISVFLLISIIPALIIGFLSMNNAAEGLEELEFNSLRAVREIKANQIEDFFSEKLADVDVLSGSRDTRFAMQEIADIYASEGLDSMQYDNAAGRYQEYFTHFIEEYGYYDLFLIDNDGEIVYTQAREDDLGTNLINGQYSDSNLAEVYTQGRESRALVDYAYYEPSDAPAIFVSSPIIDEGERIGVLALQISDAAINAIMNERTGLGESGETYLVGEDNLMRSNSRFSEQATILERNINTEAVNEALNGNTDSKIIEDYRGVEVLSAYSLIETAGFNWAIIAEIDEEEALAVVSAMQTYMFWIILVVIIIVAAAASSEEQAASTQTVVDASEELVNVVERLTSIVNDFKIED